MSAPPYLLEARNLQVVRGGTRVLHIPSLVVEEGEFLSIIGPNGAGKSTLLGALCSLLAYEGEILFRGEKIGGPDLPLLQYRRKLAMVLQEPLLFNTSVFKNVARGLRFRGMSRTEAKPIVMDAMERFKIAHLKDRAARTLSGGEARRVSLARAFATNPEVLLLDEPFSALDPVIHEELIEDLEQAIRHTRTTTLFVTHDRQEAARLSTRLGVMRDGEILQVGPPDEIMNRPVNEFVASLAGVETILRGRVVRSGRGTFTVSISGREIEAVGDRKAGQTVLLCVRAQNVDLFRVKPGNRPSETNVFRGRIEKIVPLWLHKKVKLDCGFPLVAYVSDHRGPSSHLEEGMEVNASIKSVHVIPDGAR